jgi:hypothetical protein
MAQAYIREITKGFVSQKSPELGLHEFVIRLPLYKKMTTALVPNAEFSQRLAQAVGESTKLWKMFNKLPNPATFLRILVTAPVTLFSAI